MSDTWKQCEGHVVAGKFSLLRYLGGTEHSAVFLTERQSGKVPAKAAIKLVFADRKNSELQLSRWRQAAKLSHPHLISLYEMGRSDLGGMSLLYVVMEHADENLAQVLSDRALSSDESRAMLDSVLDALVYLHGKGFVHGHIKPGNILATGEELKISSDGVLRIGESTVRRGQRDAYDPPENAGGIILVPQTMSPACDVWSLGITLVEALTRDRPLPRTDEQHDLSLPQALPEPFLEIVSHCLLRHPQSRWTVAQIAVRLEGRAPLRQVQASQPQSPTTPTPRPVGQLPKTRVKRGAYALPIAVGSALVLVAILAAPRLLRHDSTAPQIPAAAVAPPLDSLSPKPRVSKPQGRPHSTFEGSVAHKESTSKAPVAVPTSVHDDTRTGEESATNELPAGDLAKGEIAQQVAPEVLQSARDSIRGTVRVTVTVNVDRAGNVEDADLESPGPSKYFARTALQAAKLWKFKPPKVGSQGVLSTWSLRFEFTRDGTKVVPSQESP